MAILITVDHLTNPDKTNCDFIVYDLSSIKILERIKL